MQCRNVRTILRFFTLGSPAMAVRPRYCSATDRSMGTSNASSLDLPASHGTGSCVWTPKTSCGAIQRAEMGSTPLPGLSIDVGSGLGAGPRTRMEQRRSNTSLPNAQLGDILLATQTFQHNADLLLRRVLPTRLASDVRQHLFCRRFARYGFLLHLSSLRLR